MKYKLGYISTQKQFENLKDVTNGLGYNNVGYVQPTDFGSSESMNFDLAKDLANKVDAIVVADSDIQIPDLVSYFVRQSKHLLFLGKYKHVLKSAKELESLLHESGTILQIANLERNKPIYTSLRQYLKKPKYCRLERWTTSHINMADQLVDDIDMAVNCFQSNVANVDCHTGSIFSSNVDLINIKLGFQNGANADIQLHAAGTEHRSEGLFVAENGYYKVDFNNHEIVEIVHSADQQLSLIDDLDAQPRLTKFNKKILSFNPMRKAFQNFHENISEGFTPLVNIDDAKNIADVLQKAEYIMQRNCVNWA